MDKRQLDAIEEIFFLSSNRKTFANATDKEGFFATWTEYYFKNCPELIYLDEENGQILGYLMGCANSAAAMEFYRSRLANYSVFQDLFSRFPAHLHINVHPTARSKGVGARLISRFVEELKRRNVRGVHIVTSPGSPNTQFYLRNGFTHQVTREYTSYSLHFMGREL